MNLLKTLIIDVLLILLGGAGAVIYFTYTGSKLNFKKGK